MIEKNYQELNNNNVEVIKMSDIKEEEIEWLWYPYIPFGKITIIQGDPGEGKSTFILNVAAKLSKGETLDNDMLVSEPMNIIYQTLEDGLEDTVKPRLVNAGADCERIMVINESDSSLSMVDERLRQIIISHNIRLLILDPLQAYLGNKVDMNKANEVREVTKKLSILAKETRCAIVIIGHMNKNQKNKAIYRGLGSIDIFAVARSVLLIGKLKEQEDTRVVVQIKNNLAKMGKSKYFKLQEDKFVWKGDIDITGEELINGFSKTTKAKKWLRKLAETTNQIKSSDIYELAEEEGIAKRTLNSAKRELAINAVKVKDIWYWDLSEVK